MADLSTMITSLSAAGGGYFSLRMILEWIKRMRVTDQSNSTEVASLKMAQDMIEILRKELDDERGLRRKAEAELREARLEYLAAREQDRQEIERLNDEVASLKVKIEELSYALKKATNA